MTLKSKLFVTAASLLLIGGGFFGVAQTQSLPPQTDSVAASAPHDLTKADQALLLSLLNADLSLPREGQLAELKDRWSPAFIAPSIEMFNFIYDPRFRTAIKEHLERTTGQNYGDDMNAWYHWLWNQPEMKTKGYDNFKAEFYKDIDSRFEAYFKDQAHTSRIRLDEIRWGGVKQDGIPPLRRPKMISAKKANYLGDDNIVFGIELNGDVRAYPKRILAWHEMFVDKVGGINVAGVYCTLCGTVILYETDLGGVSYNIGTSGFLYRSNKLMYDRETQSLWNTIKGEPVLGKLAGKNIVLAHRSVVTTTWGEWKRRHPKTKVLSLETGHNRDYDAGVAYHQYFATDDLMFNTPYNDQRLKNKDEVLALRFKSYPFEQLAISVKFLDKNKVYRDAVGPQNILVLTDRSGGNRVYDPKDIVIETFDGDKSAVDADGQIWTLYESKLVSNDGRELKRLPYSRAFWFGWHATYPKSRLVK